MKEDQKRRVEFLCRGILDHKLEANELSVEDLEQVHARFVEMEFQARAQLVKAEQELLSRDNLNSEEKELLKKIHAFLK